MKKRHDPISAWSRNYRHRRRFNRMDPDPDPEEPPSPPISAFPVQAKDWKRSKFFTKQDWRQFWVDNLRTRVNAPYSSDKDLYSAVERSRRIYFRKIQDKPTSQDPDIPKCYYWNSDQVHAWSRQAQLPQVVQDHFLNYKITGRQLITVDATKLVKMGIYELPIIKAVTKAIRDLLGLPPPNGLRPIGRVPPMETFLLMKAPTGRKADGLTFKQFCISNRIDYESARMAFQQGYKPLPACCRVLIRPTSGESVTWIPYNFPTFRVPDGNLSSSSSCFDDIGSSSSGRSNVSNHSVGHVPTVEEIVNNVYLRGSLISDLIDDIMRSVFEKSENGTIEEKIAERILQEHLERTYSSLGVIKSEEKLEIVKVLAEELVQDLLRSKEVLEDIENFRDTMKKAVCGKDRGSLHHGVGYFVTELMQTVAATAITQMDKMAETELKSKRAERNRIESGSFLFSNNICGQDSGKEIQTLLDKRWETDDDGAGSNLSGSVFSRT